MFVKGDRLVCVEPLGKHLTQGKEYFCEENSGEEYTGVISDIIPVMRRYYTHRFVLAKTLSMEAGAIEYEEIMSYAKILDQ
jgi:hypothetical protein